MLSDHLLRQHESSRPVVDLTRALGGYSNEPRYRLRDPSQRRARHRVVPILATITVLAGCAVAAVTASSHWARHQFVLSFTHEPSNFADLYFSTPIDLPGTFTPAVPLAVPVGITNVSDQPHLYTVLVSARGAQGLTTPEGSFTMPLQPHAAGVRVLSVALPADTRVLQVSLVGHPRTILRLHLRPARHNVR
jgi:hypothetical protein